MSLQRFQLDLAARLEASAFFANIPVLVFRPRAALTAAEVQDRINSALGAITALNGKAGLCATVLMPLLNTEKQELPGPYMHLRCTIRVQENVMVNMGPNGTRIACEDAAIAVAQTLHLWTPGGTAGIIRAATETIRPNTDIKEMVTYEVQVESDLDFQGIAKTAQPFITINDAQVSIACADTDAAIYYTIDGSMPWPGNDTYPSTATLYTVPFTAAEDTLVRAAAYNPALLGSDIDWLHL